MMQQQIYQQDQQPGTTQDASGHQMVLCPVRVVYETQMLVQPGEQLQPNQTIFINPQNPPPWIQNRPVQNQVIYVQQMPTNYVQQQQHIDPNQLYIPNYGYQNLQQMLVQNPQEQIRPMQMIQQNIGSNAQLGQPVQTQRLIPNVNQISNTLNIVNAQNQNISLNRQIPHSQITNITEIVNNVKQENVSQNIYRPVVTQPVPPDPRNQMPQTVTIVPTNVQRPSNVYEPNVGQVQPMPPQNIANVQPPYQNTMVNLQDSRKISVPMNKTNNYNIVHPNPSTKGQQIFRPIQPRTQLRNTGPQFQLSVQPTTNLVQPNTPNIVNINSVPQKMIASKTVQIPTISISNNTKMEGNSICISRKRKSESPDDIHKKITASAVPMQSNESPVIIKRIENVTNTVNCSDVGVNTSPIHKPDNRISLSSLQIM